MKHPRTIKAELQRIFDYFKKVGYIPGFKSPLCNLRVWTQEEDIDAGWCVLSNEQDGVLSLLFRVRKDAHPNIEAEIERLVEFFNAVPNGTTVRKPLAP